MTKKNWLTLFLFLITMAATLLGGLIIAKSVDTSYKEDIDKNGVIIKAIIDSKTANKGRTVYFKYLYKGNLYKNQDEGSAFYNNLNNGDTINVKIDTLNPDNSYISSY